MFISFLFPSAALLALRLALASCLPFYRRSSSGTNSGYLSGKLVSGDIP